MSGTFDSKIEKAENGCWLWTDALFRDGYGAVSVNRKMLRAHRVALARSGVDVPKGAFVCHTCDTPRCVNPSHLYVGSSQQNVDDAVARDRHMRGTRSPHAKLTDEDVIAIRQASGTHNEIAAQYGVARPTISMIRKRKTWKHLP